nr:hypothetical protein [Psychrobacter proteolyticus]
MGVDNATSYTQSLFSDGRAAISHELNSRELNDDEDVIGTDNDALLALIEWLWSRKK